MEGWMDLGIINLIMIVINFYKEKISSGRTVFNKDSHDCESFICELCF